MILLHLILVLLIGGALAWWSERFGDQCPRLVALAIVLLDLAYLVFYLGDINPERFSLIPTANDASSWLIALKIEWIPRFGINLEVAADGPRDFSKPIFCGLWLV